MDATERPGAIEEPRGLRSDVVVLRRWSFDDLGCVEEAGRDPAITGETTVPDHFSEEEGRAFVERQWGRAGSGEGISLAIVDGDPGRAAGLVCLLHRPQPGVVGLGYWIVASRRRRGLARAGVVLLSRWAIGLLAVDRIEALVDPSNDASIGVLEAAGFEREVVRRDRVGADGDRRDALVFSLVAADLA